MTVSVRVERPSPESTFYSKDPITELDTALRRGFLVSVRLSTHPELRKERERAKAETLRGLEELRQRTVAKGVTFEQQLEAEYRGVLAGYVAVLRRGLDEPSNLWAQQGALGAMEAFWTWRELGGKAADDIQAFFNSDHFRSVPWVDIQCRIHAMLMTQPQAIESGDGDDIAHLAVALPAAEFVVTDRKMAHRLKSRGIASQWNSRAYSLSDMEDLLADLERI